MSGEPRRKPTQKQSLPAVFKALLVAAQVELAHWSQAELMALLEAMAGGRAVILPLDAADYCDGVEAAIRALASQPEHRDLTEPEAIAACLCFNLNQAYGVALRNFREAQAREAQHAE